MTRQPHRWILLFTAAVLVLAACGGTDGAELPTVDPNLPEVPDTIGACVPDEPECDDTVVVDTEPEPLPPGSEPADDGGETVSGGMLVDGGLSVSEALATDATGIIAVRGFLLIEGSDARLCEVLAESFPPQCGGSNLAVSGHESVAFPPLINEGNVTWSNEQVVVYGELADGTLIANPNVTG